jgi:hypothetical protein
VRRHRSGGPHEIRWSGRGQIRVWSSVCKDKPPWVLESTDKCSVYCPKGAAALDGLAGGEVLLRLVNVPHGEVRGVLLVR